MNRVEGTTPTVPAGAVDAGPLKIRVAAADTRGETSATRVLARLEEAAMPAKQHMPTKQHMPIVSLAQLAHAGQVDRHGRPYIFHVLRVADRVAAAGHGDTAIDVALLHDILKPGIRTTHPKFDPADRITIDNLRSDGVPEPVVAAVEILTRRDDETYRKYIRRIVASGNRLALVVKLDGDLADHLDPDLSDGLTPPLERRYLDAQQVLRAALAELDEGA